MASITSDVGFSEMTSTTSDVEYLDIEEVKSQIRRFRSKGQYGAGLKYINRLPEGLQRTVAIAIEIAQLFLVQGHYARAAEACTKAAPPIFIEKSKDQELATAIWDEDSVCLELLRAYIDISRLSKLRTAVSIAARINDIWLVPEEREDIYIAVGTPSSHTYQHHVSKRLAQYQVLSGNSNHSVVKNDDITIPESRILMEFYYHKIMVVAAEQGLIDETTTKSNAANRLGFLQAFAESRNRLREARFLVYFRTNIMSDIPQVRNLLQDFLDALSGTTLEIEKALTLVDLAEWQMKSNNQQITKTIEENFKEAREIFERTGHMHGALDIEDILLSEAQGLTEGELFLRKRQLAERYFQADCYQNGIRCLMFALSPAVSVGGHHEEIRQSIERLEPKIEEIGGELLKQVWFIHSVSVAILQAPEYGYALKSLERYFAEPPPEIGPKNYGLLTLSLRQVYANFGDFGKALEYAETALRIFEENTSYDDTSDAAFQLAWSRSECRGLYAPGTQKELDCIKSAIHLLKEWVERDSEHGYKVGEQQKCHLLAELEDYRAFFHSDKDASSRAEEWLERAQAVYANSGVLKPNFTIEMEVRIKIREMKFGEAFSIAFSHLQACQKMPAASLIQMAQSNSLVATTLHMYARHQFQEILAESEEDAAAALQLLFNAAKYAFDTLALYRRTKGAQVIVTATNFAWSLIDDIATFRPQQGKELFKAFMKELETTEEFCDSIRRSTAPTEDIQSLMEKRLLVSHKEHLKLYAAGVKACLKLEDYPSAWLWIQKGKARSLSDTFGLRALIPERILQTIIQNQTALTLYENERKSAINVLNASPLGYIGAARRAEADRAEMMKNPILAQVVALREGAFDIDIEASELEVALHACHMSKHQVKYIDWFVQHIPNEKIQCIVLFVRQLDGTTYTRNLSTTTDEVARWIRKALEFPEGADPPLSKKTGNRLLAEMDGLVHGLEDLTLEDDLLILSPSGLLNSVPLHGLKVGGRPLIDRNLIIYSSSAAVFRHSLVRANSQLARPCTGQQQGQQHQQQNRTSFLAVYEDLTPAGSKERSQIFENVEKLASLFPGEIIRGPSVTKGRFQLQCQNSNWIHYHGHAIYRKDNVLKSALSLSDGTDLFEDLEPGNESLRNDADAGRYDLTVPDLFSISMTENAPHFTIIACDSGTQDIAAGDEPLGLIPALLYAGATSVLGCLWPIESPAGRIFSEEFYKRLRCGYGDGEGENVLRPGQVINLAVALRDAVREMRDKGDGRNKYRQPYYWAPFVLNGVWYFVR